MNEWVFPESLSPDEERQLLLESSAEHLVNVAKRALEKGLAVDEFIMTVIDVDDSAWTALANQLMPGEDWQKFRDRGEKPIARGSALAKPLTTILALQVPDIETALTSPLPDNHVRTVVMARGGAAVYYLPLGVDE